MEFQLVKPSSRAIDIAGQRFGRLVAIRFLGSRLHDGSRCYECHCDCGEVLILETNRLRSGNTRSCGCLRREITVDRMTTHGGCRWPEYKVWRVMIQRCELKTSQSYPRYGGRGISVCEQWMHSFENFISDMGRRSSQNHSIERKDNNGNYEPSNCRWATRKEQNRNTRTNTFLTVGGEARCIAEWAEMRGLKKETVYARIALWWTPERAVNTPVAARYVK